MTKKRGIGFWVLILMAIFLNTWYLVGQTMCIFNYDFTVSIGLQDSEHAVTAVGVAFNKGFGIGDTIFYIPLFIIGIIGLIKRTTLGIYSMFSALAITVYWPIVCLGAVYMARDANGWNLTQYTEYTIVLSIISLYGLWGMWYVFSNRNKLNAVK